MDGQAYNPDKEYYKGNEIVITVMPPQWWSCKVEGDGEWIAPHDTKENTWVIRGNATVTVV